VVTVVDVRRHDERVLFGSIRGSVHLPAEQLPKVGRCSLTLHPKPSFINPKPMLKPPGTKHLKLKRDELLSTFAFKFNLRRFTKALLMSSEDWLRNFHFHKVGGAC
jgi:hypothetical protein